MRKKSIFFFVMTPLLLGLVAWLWLAPGLFKAPQLVLNTIDGRAIDLQALRGRPFLITFWATNCPGCIEEMPSLMSLYNEFSAKGFELIGIAMPYSPPDHVVQMVKNKQLTYPVVLDIAGDAVRAFGNVSLTPTHFLISPAGVIVKYRVGMLDMQGLREQIKGMLASI